MDQITAEDGQRNEGIELKNQWQYYFDLKGLNGIGFARFVLSLDFTVLVSIRPSIRHPHTTRDQ